MFVEIDKETGKYKETGTLCSENERFFWGWL